LATALSLALLTTTFLAGSAAATTTPGGGSKLAADNPFAGESTLPFHAPRFDKIKMADYAPAFEEGMRVHLAEMQAIADDPAQPTFENTIEKAEQSGMLLTRVAKVFFNLAQSNTNPDIQKLQAELAPKLAAHQDEIALNPKLFARVKALYAARDGITDPERKRLVERYYQNFVRAGALLNDADKATLRKLNEEESKLTTEFQTKLLAANNASALVVDDKKQLDGFSDADVAAAAEAAKSRKLDGEWVVVLQNTT